MDKTYMEGMVDAIKLWGTNCSKQATCDDCPMGKLSGINMTCQDFAKTNPRKMLSMLQEMNKETYTYFDEYCTRFPACNLPLEALAVCQCRKAVFEGYLDCNEGTSDEKCIECWKQHYRGDVTEGRD